MKVIIAGSRSIDEYETVCKLIDHAKDRLGLEITEVVHGAAPGVDRLADRWAVEHSVEPAPFPAAWDDLTAPGAVIRTNKFGKKYNVKAGFQRNQRMAEYGEVLIAIWDGKSPGTYDMIERVKARNMRVIIYQQRRGENGRCFWQCMAH